MYARTAEYTSGAGVPNEGSPVVAVGANASLTRPLAVPGQQAAMTAPAPAEPPPWDAPRFEVASTLQPASPKYSASKQAKQAAPTCGAAALGCCRVKVVSMLQPTLPVHAVAGAAAVLACRSAAQHR